MIPSIKTFPTEGEENKANCGKYDASNQLESTREMNRYFDNDEFYKIVTQKFLDKLINHFKGKPDQECTSFIKSLQNLSFQHLGSNATKYSREFSESEQFAYFLYIRDYL